MIREVRIGNTFIGGKHPVLVQTMYDKPLGGIPKDNDYIRRMLILKNMGMSVIRFSYPDINEHDALKYVVKNTPTPVVADIHFDYKNALDAIKCGVAKIRINPGNIGPFWKTGEIVKAARDAGVSIRIGLNSGSLPKNGKETDSGELPGSSELTSSEALSFSREKAVLRDEPSLRDRATGEVSSLMVNTALEYISRFENLHFYNTVVSLKASDTDVTYAANKLFSQMSDYPLHLGVTEAGGAISSCVRSTWALGRLLSEGVGSTLRYSITGSIEDEVYAGMELLRTLGLEKKGLRIVSCPMCGRKTFNTQDFLRDAQAEMLGTGKNLTVAIMGCQVNGPGEARGANIAVSGVGRKIFLYRDGEIYKETTQEEAKTELLSLIEKY